jgi:hypothetical protein
MVERKSSSEAISGSPLEQGTVLGGPVAQSGDKSRSDSRGYRTVVEVDAVMPNWLKIYPRGRPAARGSGFLDPGAVAPVPGISEDLRRFLSRSGPESVMPVTATLEEEAAFS